MGDRLDRILVARGLAATRARARDLIVRGQVRVDGATVGKPAAIVAETADLALTGPADYVSRGALKLEAALDAFGFDPAGRTCLDIGASTGGFTEVLLARGAAKVYAVDVGRDQLHPRLRSDPRVVSLEGLDARNLEPTHVPDPILAIAADVSFISLEKVLPRGLTFAARDAFLTALVKPQFEAGRDAIGKGGIVRDQAVREEQATKIAGWLAARQGWQVKGVIPSPIEGGSGNQEFLVGAILNG